MFLVLFGLGDVFLDAETLTVPEFFEFFLVVLVFLLETVGEFGVSDGFAALYVPLGENGRHFDEFCGGPFKLRLTV